MAVKCEFCGNENTVSAEYCVVCGKQLPKQVIQNNEPAQPQNNFVQQQPPVYTQPPVHTQPPVYEQPVHYGAEGNGVVSMWAYLGLIVLFSIPLVGLIAAIVMSFVPENKNLKNFARANLILAIVSFMIAVLVIVGIVSFINNVMDAIREMTEGEISNWNDIMRNFDNLEEILDEINDNREIISEASNSVSSYY